MKKEINFLSVFILVFIIIIGGTACMENSEKIEFSNSSTSGSRSSQASSPTKATESAIYSDKQIVEAVYTDYCGFSKEDILYYANLAMSRAEELPDRYLGSIASEEDAKEKAEAVWSEISRKMLESLKNEHGNEKQPLIEAVFYEKNNVWFVRTRISGIAEDGRMYGLTYGFEAIIRKSDGKVLAV